MGYITNAAYVRRKEIIHMFNPEFNPDKAARERYVQPSYKRRQLIREILSTWYVWPLFAALVYFGTH